MKPNNLTPVVLAKLGFEKPIDFDVKPDGWLVVLDYNGQKYSLPKKDWEPSLVEGTVEVEKPKRTYRKPASKAA